MYERKDKNPRPIDETGWRILEELQRNARVSFKQLAERVNLSPTAVIERVKRMEADGVITGYSTTINPRMAGYSIWALLAISINRNNPDPLVNETIATIPEVISCWSITGTNDVMLEVHAPSLEFLEDLLAELSKVGRITTHIVLPRSTKKRTISPPRESLHN